MSLGHLSQFEKGKDNPSLKSLRMFISGYGLADEEIEKIRQIICQTRDKKPERFNDKEALLFYQLMDLPRDSFEKVVNAVNDRHMW